MSKAPARLWLARPPPRPIRRRRVGGAASARLAADEEGRVAAPVRHAGAVPTVAGRHSLSLLLKHEADGGDDVPQVLAGGFDTLLARHVGVMVQQRSHVDPESAWPQDAADGLNELDLDHVVCAIDEEAGGHAASLLRPRVHLEEVAGGH